MKNDKIRVLVIDDSAFARKVIREVLSSDPDIDVVGIARDGLEGLEKISELKPDVVTLDLLMPDLDGLGVLKAFPKDSTTKVIVVSVSGSDTEIGLQALELGAIDLVAKPTPLPTDRLYDLSKELVFKVKAAASARVKKVDPSESPRLPFEKLLVINSPIRLIVIGTSTGGPQALHTLFSMLPAEINVPIAIALHIPEGYTAPMSARISLASKVKMTEAVEGKEILPGTAVIAPGGQHLLIEKRGEKFFSRISMQPEDTAHHPSVDVLFQSAGEAAGAGTLGVILTGMGNDGLAGSTSIKSKGGNIISESASSCIVYGMPRSVFEAGVSKLEVPLDQMAETIASLLQ